MTAHEPTSRAPSTRLACGCRYDIVDDDGHYCDPGQGHHCALGCTHR